MHDPLIFLPGAMCDARVFAPQLAAFSARAAVTVAPITGGERMEEIAFQLLNVLPERFALAGLGLGGLVAIEMSYRAPERISRIAMMDTDWLSETPETAAELEPLIVKLKTGQLEDAVKAFYRSESLAPGPNRLRIISRLVEMARNLGAEAIISQIRALQKRRDYRDALRECLIPSLILCGALDPHAPPKRHRVMAELMPRSNFMIIEGSGQLPVLEKPDTVNRALFDWLVHSKV